MRRATLWMAFAIAIALLAPGVAHAQEPPADVPPGPATLRGQLVNPDTPDAVGGKIVVLYSLSIDGEPGLRKATTDEWGEFSFEGISNDPSIVYLVGARSGEVPFGARVVFAAGELEKDVSVSLSGTTTDTSAIEIGDAHIRVDPGCTALLVRHTHELRNDSGQVIYIGKEERAGHDPLFSVLLPEIASDFESSLSERGLEIEGRRVRYWGPLYPGAQEIEFGYGIPRMEEIALEIGLPDGVNTVQLLTPAQGIRANGASLSLATEVQDGLRTRLSQTAGPIDPGGSLDLSLSLLPSTQAQRAILRETRLVLELDDAAIDIQEQHELRVSGDEPLSANSVEPLLCIPVPDAAESLRFSGAALEMGLSRDPSGALAVYGPLPAGDSVLALRYLIPVEGEPVVFEQRFESALARFTVLIADNGLTAETDRLHSLRPMRTEDRSYLHLEGFAIEAGETLSLTLTRLEKRRDQSTFATSGVIVLGALSAIVFLIGPLRAGRRPESAEPAILRATVEREAVIGTLRDLDEDYETGKLSEADHAQMRDELRARAVALLREEREGSKREPTESAAFCAQCGASLRSGDRFCAQCGASLPATDAAGGGAA